MRGLQSFLVGILALAISASTLAPKNARAMAVPIPPYDLAASVAAFLLCKSGDSLGNCRAVAFVADPVGPDITDISLTIQYDASLFTFDNPASGFLCQFSSAGDCPAAGASIGTQPVQLLPSSGFIPGSPLPGSTVSLTDTGSEVTLDYHLGTPVTVDEDTNFFLFSFDFKTPMDVNLDESTVTYAGVDDPLGASFTQTSFTQTNFACSTTQIADTGCGGNPGISGITLNLVPTPEPESWLLFLSSLAGLLAFSCAFRARREGRRWKGVADARLS
jgi:hypothetical protein